MAEIQPTTFAAKLIDLAAMFGYDCGDLHVFVGAKTFVPSLTAPELSTGGGKQMVQHLRLSPLEGGAGPALVFGTVRQMARHAELRSRDYVIASATQRSRGPSIELDALTYGQMLVAAQKFFERQGYTVAVVEGDPLADSAPAAAAPEAESSGLPKGVLIGGILGLLAAAGVIAFFFLK